MLSDLVIELAQLLLGDLGSAAPQNIRFAVPSSPRDISKIRSISDASLVQPGARKGCAIGWRSSNGLSRRPPIVSALILDSNTAPLEIQDLGAHEYGGPGLAPRANSRPLGEGYVSRDRIGHIYTRYGGIVDLGHLRDHADLTRYIATQVVRLFRNGGTFTLGDDTDYLRDATGERRVTIKPQGTEPSAYQAAVLGAVISYQVAVWHEIATFKTMQDYSTFSPEDNFTNLLGAYLGFLACIDDRLDYDVAMTTAIARTLTRLGAVPRNLTTAIVDYLENRWYTYDIDVLVENFKPRFKQPIAFPDIFLTVLRRHCETGFNQNPIDRPNPSLQVSPWLITDASRTLTREIREAIVPDPPAFQRVSIDIPVADENGVDLRTYYTFEILNAANKDDDILANSLVNGTLDSSKLGFCAEQVRDKYRMQFGLDTDSPRIGA